MSMKCKKHPYYQGACRPRTNCLDCWKIYAEKVEQRRKELLSEANSRITAQYEQIRAEHVFEGEPECVLCGCFGPVEDDQPCVPRKDLLKRIRDLEAWVRDLQSGMYINCAYCGHRYGPEKDTPASMADVLKQHIEVCPKHPMSALKVERDELQGSCDLRRQADMRAIKLWQAAHPGNDLMWPDHVGLCAWLMEQLDEARRKLEEVRKPRVDAIAYMWSLERHP